jgi:hypothetical protein
MVCQSNNATVDVFPKLAASMEKMRTSTSTPLLSLH